MFKIVHPTCMLGAQFQMAVKNLSESNNQITQTAQLYVGSYGNFSSNVQMTQESKTLGKHA